jgi:hypothetical protein
MNQTYLAFYFAVCYNLSKRIIGGEYQMLIKGIVEEMFDKEAIVVFEEYNDVSFWFNRKDLPVDTQEGDIIDIETSDDFQIPAKHSIKEPYESDGMFRVVRIDHEENKRRDEAISRSLHKLHHGW